jgi:hypothetical protein
LFSGGWGKRRGEGGRGSGIGCGGGVWVLWPRIDLAFMGRLCAGRGKLCAKSDDRFQMADDSGRK